MIFGQHRHLITNTVGLYRENDTANYDHDHMHGAGLPALIVA